VVTLYPTYSTLWRLILQSMVQELYFCTTCNSQCLRHILQSWLYTGWAKKTGPFLNVDNFAMVSGRKACYMSKVCLKKYKTCIAVCLNILCLICINIHYPWKYAEFDDNAYFNEFSLSTQWNNSDHLHTWLVESKFNMGTLDLDNHHQSFWRLIDRSI